MSLRKEFKLLSFFLLLIIATIHQGDAGQQASGETPVIQDARLQMGFKYNSGKVADGACSRPGQFFGDTEDCTIFYVCDNANKTVQFTCPEGTFYNPEINSCVENYDCPFAPVCENAGQLLPNEEDCSSFYFCSEAGTDALLEDCPEGQFFNTADNLCEDKALVNCSGRPGCTYPGESIPNVNDCDSYYVCNPSLTPIKISCPDGSSWDTVTHNCVPTAQATCASKLNKALLKVCKGILSPRNAREVVGTCSRPGEFLPDDKNCSIFYVCDENPKPPQTFHCPAGELWNPEIHDCDANYECPLTPVCENQAQVFPNNLDCASFYFCETAGGAPALYECGDGQFFNYASHVCESSEGVDCQGRPGCTYAGQSFPNVADCTSYFVCNPSLDPIIVHCPVNSSWDTATHNCIPTANANCAVAPSTIATTTNIPSTPTATCTTVGQTYADPYDCAAYYQCDANLKPNHHICEAGTLWDSDSGLCQDEDTVTCNAITNPTTETTTGGSSTDCTEPGQVIYSKTDCTVFFTCDNALIERAHYCNPIAQLYYDPAYGNCNFITRVVCSNGVRPEPTPTAFPISEPTPPPGTVVCLQPGQFLPFEADCKYFYKCSHNLTPERFSCPPNLLFNESTGCCDSPQYAHCDAM